VLLASLPIVAACLWVADLGVWAQPEAWVAKATMLIVGIGLSVAGYVTAHALLRSDEMDFLWGLVHRKLRREPS
jgi:TM2 domain-containing membrane protein YozV